MAGYYDYANMDPNILQSFATQGNARAIFEMRKRGMQVPRAGVWAPPTGGPGMDMSGRPQAMPMVEQPAYLDTGITRDMARPGATASPDAMAFMRAGERLTPGMNAPQPMPGLERPAYLQRGQQQSGDARIAAIANGGDAAGAIQAGAAAADNVTGNASPGANLPGPLGPMAAAMAEMDDQPDDKYGSTIDQMIQELMAGKDPSANRNMALAQAGFAMAASGSPFFFQAAGVGGQAGLKAYQDAQKEDMLRRVQAAQLAGDRSQQLEGMRHNRVGEGLEKGRLDETVRSNQTAEQQRVTEFEETKRRNRAAEAIDRGQLAISGQSASIALQNLRLAQAKFADEQQRYKDGLADEKALRQAEIDYRKALAAGQNALNVDRSKDIVYTEGGGAAIVDKTTGKSATIVDEATGEPIKAMPKTGATAAMKNARYYAEIGLFPSERDASAFMLSGKSMAPDRRLATAYDMADAWMMSNPQYTGDDAKREEMAQQYLGMLEAAATSPGVAAPGAATPSSEAPASTAAPAGGIAVGATATNPKTKEKVRWNGTAWEPVK